MFFLRDPARLTLPRFSRDGRQHLGSWSWPLALRRFLKGERPGDVELFRLPPPQWMAHQRLLVTPEAGPLDRAR